MDRVAPKDEEYIFKGKAAISQTDLKGDITFVNRKFCEISGYAADELINKNQNIIRHPDVKAETFEKMWQTLNSSKIWSGTLKNLRKDGSYYWVNIEIAPIFDKQKKITGFISVSKPASKRNI